VLAAAALFSSAACWKYDESRGTFKLTATGGIVIETRGRVRAFHTAMLSDMGPSYLISLEVDSASPPLSGFSALVIETQERPTGNVRFIHASAGMKGEPRTASVGLNVPSGFVSEWDTDSAIVEFKAVRGRHAVAGAFVLYVNCDHCDPPKKGAHSVLRGSFETHD
jgi:hypothetical protein